LLIGEFAFLIREWFYIGVLTVWLRGLFVGYPATKDNLPPMMVRYLEFKERYPDALLFFQVGDFYELFYDDAITVAKSLNLTLTSRDKNSPEPVPMCGVPLSVLDGYIDRLLPLGFSVAVVSQTGSGQGVDRVLERFVTPGMRLFTSVSSDSTESLIAAVALDSLNRSAAIVCTDPQTGIVRVKEGVDLVNLPRELGGWMVREVVVARSIAGEKIDRRTSWVRGIEGVVGSAAIRFRPEAIGSVAAEEAMATDAQAEFHALSPAAKRATRMLLNYLDEISLGNSLPVREVSLQRGVGQVVIDAATRRNLELVQNTKDGSSNGTLFGFLNATETPGGARLLKSWIVSPLADLVRIKARQAGVFELKEFYGTISKVLSGLSDLERLAARLQLGVASPKDLGAIRDTLEQIPVLQDALAHCQSDDIKQAVASLAVPIDLRILLRDSLVDSPPYVTNDGGIFKSGFDQELDEIRAVRANADEWRAQFESVERSSTGINSLKVKSNNVIGFFIEVPTAHGSKVPEHYQRRQSTANAERFTTPELKKYEDQVVTAVDRQVRREMKLFAELRDKAAIYVETLRKVASSLSILDALGALARAAEVNQWIAPEVDEGGVLSIDRGRHPIIERILGGSFIPNSVAFGAEAPRCFIITGPNMGGKSTYLRQIALITVLAQMGSYVPASSAQIGIVDRIFARLGAADDLHEGESTFMVEMREAAHILSHATERSLVLIDELGRGTATTDGQSLAQAILERLSFEVGCRTLFATHYHEITALERVSSRIRNLSVGSVEEDDRVVFTHAIQDGPAPRSYGLEVAKLSGLPGSVLSRAAEILIQIPARPSAVEYQTNPQRSLFEPAVVTIPAPKSDPEDLRLKQYVKNIDPDSLSPRMALETLYEIKSLVKYLALFVVLLPAFVMAAPTSPLVKLRGEYFRLRNIDPTGEESSHIKSWDALASRIREVVDRTRGAEATELRVLGAETQLRLYRSTKNRSYLSAAALMIKPALAVQSLGAEDANIIAGDIDLYAGSYNAARSHYEIAARSPGRAFQLATQRLQGLRNGTFKRFLPSQDREVPRLISGRDARTRANSGPVIVLDPGHGGGDSGAVSPFGGEEKEITLDIARRVKALLERRHQLKVQLTREEDKFVPLARRTAFANRKGGAVFVSLHVNASEKHDAAGLEAYYLDNTNDEASRKLAERENGVAAGDRIDDLSFMLSDLIQSGKLEDSIHLTREVETSLRSKVMKSHKELRSLGVKKAPFFVLVGAHMPCSLIEMFFVDNPIEGRKLGDTGFRSMLAAGIADGILKFLRRK
jgi:DNA mismatch repair protein MutS